MPKNLKKFGETLKKLRIKQDITLREACRKTGYDPSNWSKIERGKISPPSDSKTLKKWGEVLGLSKNAQEEFVDQAKIAQGIIPEDILSQKGAVGLLPAFFRTMRNKKPTKKEVNQIIEKIKEA